MGAGLSELPGLAARGAQVRRLGRYELIQLLAKGGMGELHLARTRGLGGFERLVVVKCALPSLAERTQSMLLAEARLAATLQHTNIVQVHDVGTDGETVFLAMEYLHGQDMRAAVRRTRPLQLDQAIAIVIAVCAGLHYAHEKRDTDGSPLEIVHRDVSPSNVFVTYDGGVKLIDFGIAKAMSLPSETQLGTLKGKPGYMSPEQCRCEPLDRRSDLFCVGILLYELTTGRRAFHADNEYLLQKRILDEDPPRPTSFDASYPLELEAIVMRALAKDRRDRQATALALQDELVALASARRLDLSQIALGKWIAALFADELAAWHDAQRAGQSLVDHVIKRTTTSTAIVAEPPVGTVETASPKTVDLKSADVRGTRRRRGWLLASIVALAAGAIAITTVSSMRTGATGDTAPVAAPVAAPAPVPVPVPDPVPDPVRVPIPVPVPASQPAPTPPPPRRKSVRPKPATPPKPAPAPTTPPASDPDQPI